VSLMADELFSTLRSGESLEAGLVQHLDWETYTTYPEPFPRRRFQTSEVERSIWRYPNPERPPEFFQWDIHGRLLLPDTESVPGSAIVMIHGGAANEYEFLFTPDGPEALLDLTRADPSTARVGIAQHVASLGVPVLAISLPGHYSRQAWPPIDSRQPEFVLGAQPGPDELRNRLLVYTFRMCVEAVKALIEQALPDYAVSIWGHSTGGEFLYLLEQYGLRNRILGGLGFGSGMPAALKGEWDQAVAAGGAVEPRTGHRPLEYLARRSPDGYERSGYTGPNQPWGSAEAWFRAEQHRRPMFKPLWQTVEHFPDESYWDEARQRCGLPDDELFITLRPELERLRDKRLLFFVGGLDRGHWLEGAERGLEGRREVYGLQRLAHYADQVRLVVIPRLTHYGHIEAYNERLGNLFVAGLAEYLQPAGRPASA
jgi:hypothetical protein